MQGKLLAVIELFNIVANDVEAKKLLVATEFATNETQCNVNLQHCYYCKF